MATDQPPIVLEVSELQELAGFSALCAERVLPIFEQAMPADSRPQEAIGAAKTFATNGKRSNTLRSYGLAAHKAGGQAITLAATEVARSATQAVGAAYLHPLYDAIQVKHILGSAAHAVFALELAQNSQAGKNDFLDWVVNHAPATLRSVLRRYPPVAPGKGRLNEIMRELDVALRK